MQKILSIIFISIAFSGTAHAFGKSATKEGPIVSDFSKIRKFAEGFAGQYTQINCEGETAVDSVPENKKLNIAVREEYRVIEGRNRRKEIPYMHVEVEKRLSSQPFKVFKLSNLVERTPISEKEPWGGRTRGSILEFSNRIRGQSILSYKKDTSYSGGRDSDSDSLHYLYKMTLNEDMTELRVDIEFNFWTPKNKGGEGRGNDPKGYCVYSRVK